MKNSTDKKRKFSLRAAALLLAGLCFAFFTGVFFVVFYYTMPNMLLTIEKKYLQDQADFLADRFADIQGNISANALDIGIWSECVSFVNGENPDFMKNNWAGGLPTRLFRYNFMLIKDADGNNLYVDFYDYVNDRPMPQPPGISGRLSVFSNEVVMKNRAPAPEAAPLNSLGTSGVFFYDNVPYFVSVMPVMPSRESGGAVGTVILGLIVDDSYLQTLSTFENVNFEWDQTYIYLQNEQGGLSRAGSTFEIASMPITDIYGKPTHLLMSGPRLMYAQGQQAIIYTSVLILVLVAILGMLLYIIINRMFMRPMKKLKAGITNIAFSGNKLNLPEIARTNEFYVVGCEINDMVERLNRSKTMQSVLDGMDACLYVTDPTNDHILFMSKKMIANFGLAGEVTDKACWEVLRKSAASRCKNCPLNSISEELINSVEWEELDAHTRRYYRNTGKLIEWVDGRTVYIQHCVDITVERARELQLTEAKEQAEQANRAKSDFLSRMSHEIRTPMNAIIGMANIARSSKDPERKEYCLDKIDDASSHLLGIINDILDVSKIEAGKFELSYSEFSFEAMLKHVETVVNFRIEEKQQSLSVRLAPDIPEYINCDEQRLAQVLTNLLSNAVKFTPEHGAISLTVSVISNSGDSSMIRVSVADTGIGISREQQKKLFSAFEQGDGGISRKFGGTGLGLVICKNIIEMLGGEIWVESEPNKGANFIFEISVKHGNKKTPPYADVGDDNNSSAAAHGVPENGAFTAGGCFKGFRALLAEDVDINREIVFALLEGTDLDIVSAEDGAEAVTKFEKSPESFHIILMDIHMPEVDGLEATRRIRALDSEYARQIPIIAMTANVFREDVERCIAVGMNDHIGKPINSDELMSKLEKHLAVCNAYAHKL